MRTHLDGWSIGASVRGLLAPGVLALASCVLLAPSARAEEDSAPAPPLPAWAKVSPLQVAAARELGVPVAFENTWGMRFVIVPAGTFLMGSPASEVAGRGWDRPQHPVELTEAFYLQVTEVTNAQFRRWRPDHGSGSCPGGSLNGHQQPVVRVSWRDAVDFARWLSAQDHGRRYTLPSEARWEYACRAGTTTRFPRGDTLTAEEDNVDGRPDGPFRGRTVDVATFDPNPWGLHDLNGNVAEYCSTWFWPYPAHREVDPVGGLYPTQGRVNRGGVWAFAPVSGAVRGYNPMSSRDDLVGFRLACPVATTPALRAPSPPGIEDTTTSSRLRWRRPPLWVPREARAGREASFRSAEGAECWIVVAGGPAADPEAWFRGWVQRLGRPGDWPDLLGYSALLDVMGHEAALFRIDGRYDDGAGTKYGNASVLGMAIVRPHDTIFVTRLGPELRSHFEAEDFLGFCRSLRAR